VVDYDKTISWEKPDRGQRSIVKNVVKDFGLGAQIDRADFAQLNVRRMVASLKNRARNAYNAEFSFADLVAAIRRSFVRGNVIVKAILDASFSTDTFLFTTKNMRRGKAIRYLNIASLCRSIWGELWKRQKRFTTSTVTMATTDWKTFNFATANTATASRFAAPIVAGATS
jgi:hypothetical protein